MSRQNILHFPAEEQTPLTSEKLQELGFKYCHKEMLAHNKCIIGAKNKFLKEGKDTEGPEWAVHQMFECSNEQKASNKCMIDERDKELKATAAIIEDLEYGIITPLDVLKMREREQEQQKQQQQQKEKQEQQEQQPQLSSTTAVQKKEEEKHVENLKEKKPWYRFGF